MIAPSLRAANVPRTPRPITRPRGLPAIVRKLHAWELLHLREHAAALEAENERLQRELDYANSCAESWRDDVMRLMEEGMPLGLTQSGHVVLVDAGSAS